MESLFFPECANDLQNSILRFSKELLIRKDVLLLEFFVLKGKHEECKNNSCKVTSRLTYLARELLSA